jgi:hypothetical protein
VLPDTSVLHHQALRFAKAQMLAVHRTFATATQTKAWAFGIVPVKVVDPMRQQCGESPAGDLWMRADADGPPLLSGVGHSWAIDVWSASPAAMNDPERSYSLMGLVWPMHAD